VIEHCGGSIGQEPGLVRKVLEDKGLIAKAATQEQIREAQVSAQEVYLAAAFILGSGRKRYRKLLEDLENDYTQGQDNFPKTVTAAYSRLTNWKQNESKERETGATMLMAGAAQGEFDDYDNIEFMFLQPAKGRSAPRADYRSVLMNQPTAHVPKDWILLDNQSTVDVFYNDKLLRNIRKSDTSMDIHCNAGVTSTDMVGDLPGYDEVWYHPNGIANILSLARVKDKHRVTFDSAGGNKFVVHKTDGTTRSFLKSQRGLYFMNTATTSSTLVNTVDSNKTRYTNRDYSRALLATKLQNIIGRPSTRSYLHILENNLLPNCPVTRDDILAAEDTFGPNLGSLKDKTTQTTPEHVRTQQVDILVNIMTRYKAVTLAVDVMYVNRIPFLMTVSQHIKFGTAEMLKSKSGASLLDAIKHVKKVYATRGFKLTYILADEQFESLRADLADLGIASNCVSQDEHMPEIERYIRTVKERTRCNYNMCPFKKLPSRIIIEMVYCSIFWLNMFPPTDGISTTVSPRTLIAGHHLDYTKHCRLEFDTYVQVHEQHNNSMATRTTGAIALRPTGNAQGGYYFYSLGTGRRLNRKRWTPLPMPAEVIDRVHALARRSHASNGLSFADRDGIDPHGPADDSNNETYNPADDAADEDDDDAIFAANIAGVNAQEIDEETDEALDEAPNNGGEQENEMAEQEADYEIEHEAAAQEADYKIKPDEIGPETGPETHDKIIVLDEELIALGEEPNAEPTEDALDEQATINQTMTDTYGERSPRGYSHLHTTLAGIAMTQHSVKKGLKAFGDDGTQALLKELRQLHDWQVVEPKGPDEIT
jgi:hypothetical protein